METLATYTQFTDGLVRYFHTSHAMMHVQAGLAIYFVAQFVLRDRRASVLGLAWVAFIEFVNEALQAAYYGSWRFEDTAWDIVTTLFWPAVIVISGIYRRRRWAKVVSEAVDGEKAGPRRVPALVRSVEMVVARLPRN